MQEVNLIGKLSTGGSYVPVIEPKAITENGTYSAPEGVDGFNPVTVQVSGGGAVIEPKTITENGIYSAPSGVDGFSPVTVNVPETQPVIQSKLITENGIYSAPEGIDGYNPITVSVPIPEPNLTQLEATSNGTYLPPFGFAGFDSVTVNVPIPTSIGSVIVNKYPVVNNRTLQPIPVTLTQGKYYAFYYYDDYLYPRSGTPNRLGATAFTRASTGTTIDTFYMNYANFNISIRCTDTEVYFNNKIDNDTVYAYVTIVELDSSVTDPLIPTP